MNDRKLNQLFSAARKSAPAQPEPGFENLVLSTIRKEPLPARASLFDQLAAAFPRVAWTAAMLIVLCVTADFYVNTWSQTNLSEGIAELSEQWLFAVN